MAENSHIPSFDMLFLIAPDGEGESVLGVKVGSSSVVVVVVPGVGKSVGAWDDSSSVVGA